MAMTSWCGVGAGIWISPAIIAAKCGGIESSDFRGYLNANPGRSPLERGFHVYTYDKRLSLLCLFDRKAVQRAWKAPDPPDVAAWWQGVDAEEEKAAKGNSQHKKHKKKSPVAAPGGWNNWGHLLLRFLVPQKGP